jgi:4-hydroxybenzoate polyprenyltransferase
MDEERGVETYSFLWGRRNAVLVWLTMMTVTAGLAAMAAKSIAFELPAAMMYAVLVVTAGLLGIRFLAAKAPGRGKSLETMTGIWSLFLYLSLGVIPIALRYWGHV